MRRLVPWLASLAVAAALAAVLLWARPMAIDGDQRAWRMAAQACAVIRPGDTRESVLALGASTQADIGQDADSVALHYRYFFLGDRPGCIAMLEDGRVSRTFLDFP